MNLILVRVDDRFVHGQILESWIPYLDVQCVIVVNDYLASDDFQKAIMSMAIPDRIIIKIISIKDVAGLIHDPLLKGKRALLIVSSIKDAYKICQEGIFFTRLNIGNLKMQDGCKQLSFSVWVDHEDVDILKRFIADGVYISLQSVPRERDIDLRTIIEMIDI
ncbi:MAG: PTS sugar transporter subunit IIB [Deltaproteobacteria bacterium]|nr:PTS sugar transporter subunit IIB [Deltaproteobacteria bacterium]